MKLNTFVKTNRMCNCVFRLKIDLHCNCTLCNDIRGTGRERLIQSHSSARFSIKLSGNSN